MNQRRGHFAARIAGGTGGAEDQGPSRREGPINEALAAHA